MGRAFGGRSRGYGAHACRAAGGRLAALAPPWQRPTAPAACPVCHPCLPCSLCSVLISRLLWRWNALILPLVAAPLVVYAQPLCRGVVTSPGVELPLARLYQWLDLVQ